MVVTAYRWWCTNKRILKQKQTIIYNRSPTLHHYPSPSLNGAGIGRERKYERLIALDPANRWSMGTWWGVRWMMNTVVVCGMRECASSTLNNTPAHWHSGGENHGKTRIKTASFQVYATPGTEWRFGPLSHTHSKGHRATLEHGHHSCKCHRNRGTQEHLQCGGIYSEGGTLIRHTGV